MDYLTRWGPKADDAEALISALFTGGWDLRDAAEFTADRFGFTIEELETRLVEHFEPSPSSD